MSRIISVQPTTDGLVLLNAFYRDIYIAEFPDPNERESLANMTMYLGKREEGWYGADNYHILIAVDDHGAPVGGTIADFFAAPAAGVIEFLTVTTALRRQHLGQALHEAIIQAMQADARRGENALRYVCAEMNDPTRTDAATDNMDPRLRASVWARWGYRQLDFPYVQPALSPEQKPVTTLLLLARPMPGIPADWISSATVRAFLRDYLVKAMRIEQPENDPSFREMARFLAERQNIRLLDL